MYACHEGLSRTRVQEHQRDAGRLDVVFVAAVALPSATRVVLTQILTMIISCVRLHPPNTINRSLPMNENNEALYRTREKRITDVIELRVPDRVPITASFYFFPARYYGYTMEELMYDPDKL